MSKVMVDGFTVGDTQNGAQFELPGSGYANSYILIGTNTEFIGMEENLPGVYTLLFNYEENGTVPGIGLQDKWFLWNIEAFDPIGHNWHRVRINEVNYALIGPATVLGLNGSPNEEVPSFIQDSPPLG